MQINHYLAKAHERIFKSKTVLDYLKKRCVSKDQIVKYHLGLGFVSSFENDEFARWSRGGHLIDQKILFPIYNHNLKLIAIGVKPVNQPGGYQYFYFSKKHPAIFGLQNLPKVFEQNEAVITEGIFDFFITDQVFENSLCALSVNISNKKIRYLSRFTNNFVCVFDSDEIAQKKFSELSRNRELNFSLISNYLQYGSGIKDIGDLAVHKGLKKAKDHLKDGYNSILKV